MQVRELAPEEFPIAAAALLELRPAHGSAEALAQAAREQVATGYRVAVVERGGAVLGAAGFRVLTTLAFGRILHVDDLVTAEAHRGQGAATALLDHLDALTATEGCTQLHLDSGVVPERQAAHRRYFSHGMRITSYHFAKPIPPA
jgi:GNAT superfamily N-acetyltransferase